MRVAAEEVLMRGLSGLGIAVALVSGLMALSPGARAGSSPSDADLVAAFGKQGIRINDAEAAGIRDEVRLALDEARAHGIGNSKVDFAAVEIASRLGLDTSPGSNTVHNVVGAIRYLLDHGYSNVATARPPIRPPLEWDRYFDHTLGLWNDRSFLGLVGQKGFHPVKISWEDIGRYQGSVWGDRISDVGIWVRQEEADPATARLAISVRRDSNFRDKVLVVPASAIKVHQRVGGRTIEKTLPARLAELGLTSTSRDRNVIVSNQFAIVPVPGRTMRGASPEGVPPRAAFTFSIFPYGSTNLVITDVIEGSHVAIVGPGQHQLLFADDGGRRAPFTASRAEDRQDLLKLERELKAQGMDVDVQRYYLIQVPLRRDTAGIELSNMGAPPWRRVFQSPLGYEAGGAALDPGVEGDVPGGVVGGIVGGLPAPPPASAPAQAGIAAAQPKAKVAAESSDALARHKEAGLARVAIGHGEAEGPYHAGSGYSGARADEPIRVTVVYFVTPVAEVTRRDMDAFAAAFERWDAQAIWGGSFVTKQSF
jgi:hypothetical protein